MKYLLILNKAILLSLIIAPSAFAQSGWGVVDSIVGNRYWQIECADSLHCMAIAGYGFGYASIVRATTDGGTTWKTVHHDDDAPPLDALNYNAIAYPTPAVGLIACDSGVVLRTQDTGKTWKRFQLPTQENLFSIAMNGENNAVLMNFPSSIWRTNNQGDSWDSINISLNKESAIEFVHHLSPSTIITTLNSYLGDSATLISNDTGKTWQRYLYPTNSRSIVFLDSLTGWSCGSKPTGKGFYNNFVTHTTDGGKTWNVQLDSLIGEPFGLGDIAFADRKNGLAVGTGAKMLRTTDGGATWTFEATGLTEKRVESTFVGVAYPTPTRAFAITTFGGIYRYMGQPSGVEEREGEVDVSGHQLEASVYPNILHGDQELEVGIELVRGEICVISLVNVVGEVIREWPARMMEAGKHRQSLGVGGLASGEYFLRIRSKSGGALLPIVVR
ncbi:MAG: hypothetical protein DYG96_13870 [Chlorobi bacterium CHB2]|nr:hypothetical protein [Chlorobi bacterium CHB2]